MESVVMHSQFWQNKKVLVTGHTGFKGSWLSLWLQKLGANVAGIALAPSSNPNLFELAGVFDGMQSTFADINDLANLKSLIKDFRPDIVIHMAAQALVRPSYADPVETYQTNVMGTMHVLEAIRECDSVKAAIMVTTDKCYDNKEWDWPYREQDALGGHDPYSSSKACAEILIDSYRRSFFCDSDVAIASVRAGNVIGGGDWSEDRLIADIIRAKQKGQPLKVRYPNAIRPWQHVLEPLSAYLLLAQNLFENGPAFASAWNIGPQPEGLKSVSWIADYFSSSWPDFAWHDDSDKQLHEATTLKLDCSKIQAKLGWQPKWSIEQALSKIIEWHDLLDAGAEMKKVCLEQITQFETT
jgi:CDP-glucose 4,6-dehydratase